MGGGFPLFPPRVIRDEPVRGNLETMNGPRGICLDGSYGIWHANSEEYIRRVIQVEECTQYGVRSSRRK